MPKPEQRLDADAARLWALLTRAALATRRTEIDALNVFPVPDGDTGTNLYLTVDGALDDVLAGQGGSGPTGPTSLADEARALARALLLSARGNSGVILSQLVGGICEVIAEARVEEVDGPLLARSIRRGADLARAAVTTPQEGTILSVVDAAADGAEGSLAGGAATVPQVVAAMLDAAREALARTPDQLPVLADAGVVDAGGAGALLVLESLHRAVTGELPPAVTEAIGGGSERQHRPEWHPGVAQGGEQPARTAVVSGHQASGEGRGVDTSDYEVMYLLDETDESAVETLRARLAERGESLLVVGGPDIWNVHVHTDDPGLAVEHGIQAGRPHRIRITWFDHDHDPHAGHAPPAPRAGRHAEAPSVRPDVDHVAVVACAAGPGLRAVLEQAGATVVDSGPGRRASAGELLGAVRATGARDVVLLPNDKDTLLAAAQARDAAAEEGLTVAVVRARAAVQGLAALAVFEPARPLTDTISAMAAEAAATRHGAVTIAVKEALTWAGPCRAGDILGVIDGDFAVVGHDLAEVAGGVLTRLLAGGGEIVTLVTGAPATPALVAQVSAWLEREHPDVEVEVIDGGQPTYHLLIGVA